MPAFAYLLLPLSGTIAYLKGRTARVRFHGLQAVVIGVVWPAALYVATLVSPGPTQVVYAIGALVWIGFLLATLMGRDPRLPLVGAGLERFAAAASEDRATDAR